VAAPSEPESFGTPPEDDDDDEDDDASGLSRGSAATP